MNTFDQNGLYDIYPTWHVPFWQTNWFFWTIISAISITCLLLAYFLYCWYRAKQAKPLTPWEKALLAIAELQKHTYTNKEDGKQCYFVLTSALKKYLAERFAFPVDSKTDEEATKYLEDQSLPQDIKRGLQDILQGCLLIKFANEQAMEEQIAMHLAMANEMVKQTIPKEIKK